MEEKRRKRLEGIWEKGFKIKIKKQNAENVVIYRKNATHNLGIESKLYFWKSQ